MSETAELVKELKDTNEVIKTNFEQLQRKNEELEKSLETRDASIQELKNNLNKINNEITETRKKEDTLVKRLEEAELRSQRPDLSAKGEAPKNENFAKAFRKLVLTGNVNQLNEEERKAVYPEGYQKRGMEEDIDSKGGFLAPAIFENTIIKTAYDDAAIRPTVDARETSSRQVEIPTMGKVSVSWGTEKQVIADQDVSTGLKRIKIHKIIALVRISNELLEDSIADLFSELSAAFGAAIAEAEDDAFALGDGVNKPGGIFANADVKANYIATGVASALADANNNGFDALIRLMTKIKSTYRKVGTFYMNSQTEAQVRLLKDANKQYLWQPSVQLGMPSSLIGRPISLPEGSPDIAANAFPVVFGDGKRGYKARTRRGITIQRLNELYATTDETAFKVTYRVGGEVVLPEAFAALKVATS